MRHRSLSASINMALRAAAQAERARSREAAAQTRAAERAARAAAKEDARLYVVGRAEEAISLTNEIREKENSIDNFLRDCLNASAFSLDKIKEIYIRRQFNEAEWSAKKPQWDDFAPHFNIFDRLWFGHRKRKENAINNAQHRFDEAMRIHDAQRIKAFDAHTLSEDSKLQAIEQRNAFIDEISEGMKAKRYESVVDYFELVFEKSLSSDFDAISAEVGYAPDSSHLIVNLNLPTFDVIPEEASFKYIKSTDSLEAVMRPVAKRKAMYSRLLSQIALKGISWVYRANQDQTVECLTLNGLVNSIDPATGQAVCVCLLSVRVTQDVYATLNLTQVQPEQCLKSLKASVSRAAEELLPVKPLLEMNMVDPRFVDTLDVMSGLDDRPNLMELTPTEFEGLITNLFATMGLDTRQTRPSRDGGVDCVAFDPRPIFGGKVVIQAKRYKNTVSVSAVRDLFGTVQNEGASKGILVTTSGYGKAAFEFAKGKPLELLDGANLLHLLAEHADVNARIVMPEDWRDAPIHGE